MALIKCPECKKKVSDQCENCPNCGYPIKANITTVETEVSKKADLSKDSATKPFFKKWWFWTVVGVVIAALVLSIVLFINRDTKPKFDKDGNPVFIELTNEVYTNASKYKGYHINIKGKVFQVMGDNGENKGIQIWLDPETCEQNLMIYYSTEEEVKQGDYIICSGYIDSLTKYNNAYGAELHVPLVISTDLKKSTYKDVMAPTIVRIDPDNLFKDSHGYSVAIGYVEFSERETRINVGVFNNGKSSLYIGDSTIIQAGKQYKSLTNYEANYDEISSEILKGAFSTGWIVFPAMNPDDFELTIDVHSNDFNERLGEYTFLIGKESSKVKEPDGPSETLILENIIQKKYGYAVSIDKIEYYNEEVRVFLTAVNDGNSSLFINSDGAVIVQNGKQFNTIIDYGADYDKIPYEIVKGATASGVVSFATNNKSSFSFTIEVYSDDPDEKLGKITADISKNKSEITTAWPALPTYPSAVGKYHRHIISDGDPNNEYEYDSYLYIYSDGTLYHESIPEGPNIDIPMAGTWTQYQDKMTYSVWNINGFMWNNPFTCAVYSDGIKFLGHFYERIG